MNVSNKLFYLLAGAAVGILFAPKSGKETRSDLTGKVDDLKNKVQEKVQGSGITETVSDTMHDIVERGKNVASIGRQRVGESIEAGRRRFNESLESFESGDIASR